jgi:[protein-PII] uridylyltransferase
VRPTKSNYDKVLAHAEEQLTVADDKRLPELVEVYKRFVKLEEHRLRLLHKAGGAGRDVARRRAQLVDVLVQHSYRQAVTACSLDEGTDDCFAVVAVGGYGRAMLNPSSDVDLLFLYRDTGPERTKVVLECIEQMLYLFWDVGYKVGHATRTVEETQRHVDGDFMAQTALLEARLVTGCGELFEDLRDQFHANCVKGHEKDYIAWRIQDQANRHEKFNNTVFLQEPNVKNGCGGLRDFHNLIWVSQVKYGVARTVQLVELGVLGESERRRLVRAYDFVLRVRTELHYLSGRANDVLSLHLQGKVAENFSYDQKNILRKIEALMKDYYQHSRNMFYITNVLAERMSLIQDGRNEPAFSYLARHRRDNEHFDGFYSEDGLIYADGPQTFRQDPHRMMRVFQHAQLRELSLSPRLRQRMRPRLYTINRTFQYAKVNREIFQAILSRKGKVARVLRMMHDIDFLGRYMPEFGELTCLVQHEFFHRYTADEHTLMTVENLDAVLKNDEPGNAIYRDIFKRMEEPFVLYLALLLHDTGRASNLSPHEEISAMNAHRVARRLQLSPERRRLLIFLVDNHLLLVTTATRRNLSDPATIEEFTSICSNRDYLDALLLMTMVDSRATGENTWSEWKEALCLELYRGAARYLEDKEAYLEEVQVEKQSARAEIASLLPEDYGAEIVAHFEFMPDIYFRTYQQKAVVEHLKLLRQFMKENFATENGSLRPAVSWIDHPDQGFTEVIMASWDRKQLLARLVGSFTMASLNILSADIYSRGDDLVLDVFRVCTTNFEAVREERHREKVLKALEEAFGIDEVDFAGRFREARPSFRRNLREEIDMPSRVKVNNEASETCTVIEIDTPDRMGLLYDLVRGLYEHGLEVDFAKITTELGTAFDTFYVMDTDGEKIQGKKAIRAMQNTLMERASGSAEKAEK